MVFGKLVILFLTFMMSLFAWAGLESTSTLPQGVYSPEIVFGLINGLGQKFDNSGNIVGVADQYHMDLTGAKIAQLNSEGATLVKALNSISPNLGNSISMGSVDFQANPTIDYFVLNPAYGIRKNIAIGFAIPFIHFRSQMQIVASGGNNLQAIQGYVGKASTDVQNGLAQASAMAANMPATVQSVLIAKGYKPLGAEDINGAGDTQIYARFRYYETEKASFAVRPYLLLPTGRPDDPDDLGDLSMGGLWGMGTYLTQEYYFLPKWTASLVLQYEAHLPAVMSARVPHNQDDILPDISQKQGVNYQAGNIYDAILGCKVQLARWMQVGGFYDITFKDPDWNDGNQPGYDYAFLGHDTGYQTQKAGGFIEFSTTDFYFENRFSVPFVFGYTFSNTLAAVNSPQSISHLLNLRMFF